MRTTTVKRRHANAEAAQLFHALSDETRLEIIRLLGNGERCVCELMEPLAATQSRLSFHLKTLKDAGIVRDRRSGRWIYYTLNEAAFARMEKLLAELKPGMRIVATRQERC